MKNPTHIKQNTLLASVLALLTFTITAQTFGPYGANSFANVALSGATVKWSNPNYVTNLNDRLQATSSAAISSIGAYSSSLIVSNFNSTIDTPSTILGIIIEENRMTNSTRKTKNHSIFHSKNGVPIGSGKANNASWSSTNTFTTFGSSSDILGATLTAVKLMSSDFGVGFSVEKLSGAGSFTTSIDHVRITIQSRPLSLIVKFGRMNNSFNNAMVELNWNTYSKLNNDHFTAGKSVDDLHVETLTTVRGKETFNSMSCYKVEDSNPFYGNNYHRVVLEHFEGIHKIVGRNAFHCKRVLAAEVSLFPNPCNAQLNIKVPENESSINVEIRDVSGNIAYQGTLTPRNGYSSIDIAALALETGMHFASVSTDNFSLHKVLSFYTE